MKPSKKQPRASKKLAVRKETLRSILSNDDLAKANGGAGSTYTCPVVHTTRCVSK